MKKLLCSLLLIFSCNANSQYYFSHLSPDKDITQEIAMYPNWFIMPDVKYIRKEVPFIFKNNQPNPQIAKEYFDHLCETESFGYKTGLLYLADNQTVDLSFTKNVEKYKKIPFQDRFYTIFRQINRPYFDDYGIKGVERIVVDRKNKSLLYYQKNFKLSNKECFSSNEVKRIDKLNTYNINENNELKINGNLLIKENNIEKYNQFHIADNNRRKYVLEDTPILSNRNFISLCQYDTKVYIDPNYYNKILVLRPKWKEFKDIDIISVAYVKLLEIENNKRGNYYFYFKDEIKKLNNGMHLDFDLNVINKNDDKLSYPLIGIYPLGDTFREFVMQDGTIFRIDYDSKNKKYLPVRKVSNIKAERSVTWRRINDPVLDNNKLLGLKWYIYNTNTNLVYASYINYYENYKSNANLLKPCVIR